jgi:hypothetical protein
VESFLAAIDANDDVQNVFVASGTGRPHAVRPRIALLRPQIVPDAPRWLLLDVQALRKTRLLRATPGRAAQPTGPPAGRPARAAKRQPAVHHARWIAAGQLDDVEFSLDEATGVIHVRSASRIGHGDRGVNRARVEAIRSAFMASPAGLPAGAGAAR